MTEEQQQDNYQSALSMSRKTGRKFIELKEQLSEEDFDKLCEETIIELMVPIAKLCEKLPGHPFNTKWDKTSQGLYLYGTATEMLDNFFNQYKK